MSLPTSLIGISLCAFPRCHPQCYLPSYTTANVPHNATPSLFLGQTFPTSRSDPPSRLACSRAASAKAPPPPQGHATNMFLSAIKVSKCNICSTNNEPHICSINNVTIRHYFSNCSINNCLTSRYFSNCSINKDSTASYLSSSSGNSLSLMFSN